MADNKVENKILIVWDRMGDYHRVRTETYSRLFKEDSLYTADLGASDSLYGWNATENETHYCLSEQPADVKDLTNRFKNFKNIVEKYGINKVVLAGYGKPEYLLFTLWLKLKKIDCYYFAESWYAGNKYVNYVKGLFLRKFVKRIFVSGKRAEIHFSNRLKFPVSKIKNGYSIVDNKHFEYQRSREDVIRNHKEGPILLCVARHAPEKNLEVLIKGFQASNLYADWKLQIVGGGPITAQLESLVKDIKKVELSSWLSYDELPSLYKNASAFILPSKFEPWGLVVNEAMSASLPIILSNECGCMPDLLDGNGYLFDAENLNNLVEVLNNLEKMSTDDLFKNGERSFNIIKQFTPETWGQTLHTLLNGI
ncbi:glycosyltransferase family 4 protein [Mangrovimonas xylaniphaga]|uniref:glycosyltransferase family 4 protein n=1 Tax=Mangrovimonas xylaniphaga TaxID=1645915 RepID=UPI0006B415CD|nr:glycosyltransferase family 4 protein [Mangrovimonas xylaniphaga]